MSGDLYHHSYRDVEERMRYAAAQRQAEYALSESWGGEVVEQAQKSRRTAWIVASVMIVVCAAQAAAIALMLPLKEAVPFTLLVDRNTGYIETVRGVKLGSLPEDEAVTVAFLAQYVLARETYDPTDLRDRYSRVALWSDETARNDYVKGYQLDNPEGVLKTLGPDTRVSVTVKDVDLNSQNTAAVRFETVRRSIDGATLRQDWRAVLSFRYSGAPMRMEDRLINPLGFQVLNYRRDAETAGQTRATGVRVPQVQAQEAPSQKQTFSPSKEIAPQPPTQTIAPAAKSPPAAARPVAPAPDAPPLGSQEGTVPPATGTLPKSPRQIVGERPEL
jgi:type IV secretion system protein VirB8